ncbi:MAG: hypothetical protein AAGI07_17060 [Bacteroidota bacterium]
MLEQFTTGKSEKPVFKAPDKPDETEVLEERLEIEDEYKPILKGGEKLIQPGEHTGSILKKSIEELPTPKVSTPSLRAENYRKKKKKVNKIAALLKDKNQLRNALIMKEVFDKKYF